MDLDAEIAASDARQQAWLESNYRVAKAIQRFQWSHARRSEGQRWRWIFVKYGLKAEQEKT